MSFLLRESAMADKTTSVPTVEAIANTSRPISPDEKSLECNVDMEANKMGDSVDDIVADDSMNVPKITKIPMEILLQFVREMDLCTAVSFGLSSKFTHKVLKLAHPEPIGLMAKRVDTHIHPNDHSTQCYSNSSGELKLVCSHKSPPPGLDTLVKFLLDPTTYKRSIATEYQLTHDRGDGKWMFLKPDMFDDPNSVEMGAMGQELFNKYKDYGYFKQFDKEVDGQFRIPKRSYATATDRPSLIPTPFGINDNAWVAAVVKVMIDDMSNWERRGWWKKFWSTSHVFAGNEKRLEEAADKHEWKDIKVEDKQSAVNEYMARAARMFNACLATDTSTL